MLMPKKVKYRKQMRGRRNGKAWRGGDLAFGEYGLKAMEAAWITDRQIEASRVAITRFISAGENCGSAFFRTSLSPRSRRKRAWAKAKARRNAGFPWSSRA